MAENNFGPQFEVAACVIEFNGKFILLHRQDYKSEGNTWGLPAGKVKDNESLKEAVIREIKEETGLEIKEEDLSYFIKAEEKYPKYDFVWHMFYTKLEKFEDVRINSAEHKNFKWVSPKESMNMPLILHLDKYIKLFYEL